MLMVCILHINFFGQYNKLSWQNEPWEWLSWGGSESLCIIAVNLYAMITGYVCITSTWRIHRYITLWFQVAFYTVGLYALGFFLAYGGWIPRPGLKGVLQAMFTVPMAGAYWYFNAYTILFLLIPFLNRLLSKLSYTDYIKLLTTLLVILPFMKGNPGLFYGDGYNAMWLSALYCSGAFIRLHPIPIRKSSVCLAFYLLGATGFFLLHSSSLFNTGYLSILFLRAYVSPFSIVATLSLFLVFKNMDIQREWLKAIIRFVSPLTFGVYLIQCHPVVWKFFCNLGEELIAVHGHPVWMPWAGGLCLFIVCACIDWARRQLFRWCQTQRLTDKLAAHLTHLWLVVKVHCPLMRPTAHKGNYD